jgi:SAM-dependent methyltransferase
VRADAHAEMYRVEGTHFWFVGTRTVVMDLLTAALAGGRSGARVLDVGCGTGYTLTRLPPWARGVGLDRSSHALGLAASRGLRAQLVQGDMGRLPFAAGSFDAVLALDVLEHLQDDHGAAAEVARVLRPGGVALVTVPAFRFLWSAHDEALSHVRRYRLGEIAEVLRSAGLVVERASYYNFWLFPLIASVRLVQRLRPDREPTTDVQVPPGPVNRALTALLGSERHLLKRGSLPVGVSCILVARRPR